MATMDPSQMMASQGANNPMLNTSAGTVSGGVGAATEGTARAAANETLAAQVELMKINMEFMIAMAWLNFVLAVTSKLNGR